MAVPDQPPLGLGQAHQMQACQRRRGEIEAARAILRQQRGEPLVLFGRRHAAPVVQLERQGGGAAPRGPPPRGSPPGGTPPPSSGPPSRQVTETTYTADCGA